MKLKSPQLPAGKIQTWVRSSGLDLNITISAKDATLYAAQKGGGK